MLRRQDEEFFHNILVIGTLTLSKMILVSKTLISHSLGFQVQALHFLICVTVVKSLNLSELPFPRIYKYEGANNLQLNFGNLE